MNTLGIPAGTRVTVKDENGYCINALHFREGCLQYAVQRLGEYEDIGTVQEFRALKVRQAEEKQSEEAWDK